MLRNALQILVAVGLLGTAVCPCLAQTLLVAEDSQHAHSAGHHHADSQSLPECHGGDGDAACVGVNGTMGEVADSLSGSSFQFEDDDATDTAALQQDQPDLTHHGGSPPTPELRVAASPVTRHDRLIE